MAVYKFNGFIPVVHESSFIHPNASVTGNVIIGKNVYIGPGAAIRGDWGQIIIKDGCNVQENCTIHMFPGTTVTLNEGAHIGHGAIIHGANIGKNCLVGMNSVVMDDALIEDECIIGALCFVPANMHLPKRSLAVGNPAKIVKEVSDEMIAWKTKGTALYQQLPEECQETLEACEPLREIEKDRPNQEAIFKTWKKIKDNFEHEKKTNQLKIEHNTESGD
jgi:phenylacetic acid degradation protein